MRIRTKFFLTSTIIFALFLGCLTYYLLKSYNQFMFEKISQNSTYSISQLTQNIDSLTQSFEQITDFIYLNEDLQEKMLDAYPQFSDAHASYVNYLRPFIKSITGSRPILRLTFFTDNATYQFPDVKLINDEIKQTSWYQTMVSRKLNNLWSFEGQDDFLHLNVLRLTQRLNSYKPNANLYVSLDVNERIIYDLIAKESTKTRFTIFLPDGAVFMDSFNRDAIGMSLQNYPFYKEISESLSGSRIVQNGDQSYLLTYQTVDSRSSIRGMKVVSLNPVDELRVKIKGMLQYAVILCISFLILFSVAIYGISYGLTKRLMVLTHKMKQMNMDNLQALTVVQGNDEVSVLTRAYNRMVTRMERLIHDRYELVIQRKELELRTKESELYALQTQIHPHYLFNVLNAIYGKLLEKGDRENARMVKLLAKSFRHVLGRSGQLIYLLDELEIVETYLKIQSFRFMERMAYDIQIPERLRTIEVPKLILQTIVENAVIHGVEMNEHSTKISIIGRIADDNSLNLVVHNDGPSISQEKISEIMEMLDKGTDIKESKHIGLRNVQDRIKKIYGIEYGIQIDSSEEIGTSVTIRLPHGLIGGDNNVSSVAN